MILLNPDLLLMGSPEELENGEFRPALFSSNPTVRYDEDDRSLWDNDRENAIENGVDYAKRELKNGRIPSEERLAGALRPARSALKLRELGCGLDIISPDCLHTRMHTTYEALRIHDVLPAYSDYLGMLKRYPYRKKAWQSAIKDKFQQVIDTTSVVDGRIAAGFNVVGHGDDFSDPKMINLSGKRTHDLPNSTVEFEYTLSIRPNVSNHLECFELQYKLVSADKYSGSVVQIVAKARPVDEQSSPATTKYHTYVLANRFFGRDMILLETNMNKYNIKTSFSENTTGSNKEVSEFLKVAMARDEPFTEALGLMAFPTSEWPRNKGKNQLSVNYDETLCNLVQQALHPDDHDLRNCVPLRFE